MKYINLFFVPAIFALFLTGCVGENQNLDIAQLDQQAANLRSHLYNISGDDDYYDNKNIDFSLLKETKDVVMDRCNKIIMSHQDDMIEQEIMDEGINKSLTLLFFVWMEEFDAAQSNNDTEKLNYLKDEIESFTSVSEVSNWIKNNNKKESLDGVKKILRDMPDLVNLGLEVDANNDELNTLKNEANQYETDNNITLYNQTADKYNVLLDENNLKIEDYNTKLEEMNYEKIFSTFMKMIDASYIFPGQSSIPLEK